MSLLYGRLWHPRPALTNCKLCRMQHRELPQDAHKTQTYNICMTKNSHSSYTSTYSSTPHNTSRKHNIHHIPYTNTQHTSTLQSSINPLFLTTTATQQTFPQTSHSHYNRHKNKHASYTYNYCLYASSHIISSTAPTNASHCQPWICGQTLTE